jgi:hypothetical protein
LEEPVNRTILILFDVEAKKTLLKISSKKLVSRTNSASCRGDKILDLAGTEYDNQHTINLLG